MRDVDEEGGEDVPMRGFFCFCRPDEMRREAAKKPFQIYRGIGRKVRGWKGVETGKTCCSRPPPLCSR